MEAIVIGATGLSGQALVKRLARQKVDEYELTTQTAVDAKPDCTQPLDSVDPEVADLDLLPSPLPRQKIF